METALQIAGVMVPSFAALGGLFAWGVRRMDRRFEEARQERARIEAKLDARCDGIDARCDGIEAKFDARCDEMEAKFEERWSRLEEKIDRLGDRLEEKIDRLEERSDRVAEQLSGQITELNREVGKLQGITGVARILDVASH